MAINFPSSPNTGSIHTDGNKRWVWSGKAWDRVTSVDGSTTPTIVQGGSSDTGIDIEYVPITGVTNATINSSSYDALNSTAAIIFNEFVNTDASTSLEWDGWLIADVDNTHIYSFEISYDISKFQGNGLVNQSIRGIYVDVLASMNATNSARKAIITAVYPDGTEQVVSRCDPKDNSRISNSNNFIVCVPVNKGQTNFTLKCEVNTSSEGNADEWVSYKVIGAKCVRPVLNNPDKEYVKIDSTVGISALAETGTSDSGDKVYNLSDLRGLGLVTNNIRGIYIRFFGQYLSDSGVTFFATMPDGTVEEISQFDGQTSNGTGVGSNLLLLPINSDQASFTLSATVNNQNATRTWSWRIVGAEQVTTDVSSGITLTNGSAPYYGCRAWAHYDGINDELKANGNIASVKRNFIGNYTFTFTTPMPDANYSTNVSVSNEFSSTAGHMVPFIMNQTTTTFDVQVYDEDNSNNAKDKSYVNISVFA